MSLSAKQRRFTWMIHLLVAYAYSHGVELTYGDAYATSGHCINSKHYQRLAVDFNLFKNGEYMTKTEDHVKLGEYWESLGGTWGGRFLGEDGNHYEY